MFSDFGGSRFFKVVGKRVIYLLLFLVCSTTTSLTVLGQNAFAEGSTSTCASGILSGDNYSYFTITLTCNDVVEFYNNESTLTELPDLVNIELLTADGIINPIDATISADQLILNFLSYDLNGSIDLNIRELTILPGVVLDPLLSLNSRIDIFKSDIVDEAVPYVEDDFYQANGAVLDITAVYGLLANDAEMQSNPLTAHLVSAPTEGSVQLNPDGSFTYTPSTSNPSWSEDTFTYSAMDSSGNISVDATVTITNAPPTVSGDFYKVCDDCDNLYASVGDIVRVDVVTSKPVVISSATIAGNIVIDYQTVDDFHYFVTYQLTDDDEEGEINYSITIIDQASNEMTYSPEDPINFDKTPPEISLNSDDYIELYLDEVYEETATAYDVVSGDTVVDISGIIDPTMGGFYYLHYTSTDQAGNISEVTIRTIYVIDEIPPVITLNKLDDVKKGDSLVIGGSIDDQSSKITVTIEGRQFEVSSVNIENGHWYIIFKTDDFKLGINNIIVTATDNFNNTSSLPGSFVVKEKPTPNTYTAPVVLSSTSWYSIEDNSSSPSDTTKVEENKSDEQIQIPTKNELPVVDTPTSKIFGIDWYYWLIMLSIISILLYWIFGK